MNKRTERTNAIIVTFPVKFLIDLGKPICEGKLNVDDVTAKKFGIPGIRFTKKGFICEGYKECIRQIEALEHDDEIIWLHSMGNKPVNDADILYCYVNILSKIRYRFKVIGFDPGSEIKFDDGRKRTAKHWLLMHSPEKIMNIKMGGFQGFRYWKEDYPIKGRDYITSTLTKYR